jgi:hypothetical protein
MAHIKAPPVSLRLFVSALLDGTSQYNGTTLHYYAINQRDRFSGAVSRH